MRTYAVRTERFGVVLREDDGIKQARAWARAALGVTNPKCVNLHREYTRCGRCDSQPCVCENGSKP